MWEQVTGCSISNPPFINSIDYPSMLILSLNLHFSQEWIQEFLFIQILSKQPSWLCMEVYCNDINAEKFAALGLCKLGCKFEFRKRDCWCTQPATRPTISAEKWAKQGNTEAWILEFCCQSCCIIIRLKMPLLEFLTQNNSILK